MTHFTSKWLASSAREWLGGGGRAAWYLEVTASSARAAGPWLRTPLCERSRPAAGSSVPREPSAPDGSFGPRTARRGACGRGAFDHGFGQVRTHLDDANTALGLGSAMWKSRRRIVRCSRTCATRRSQLGGPGAAGCEHRTMNAAADVGSGGLAPRRERGSLTVALLMPTSEATPIPWGRPPPHVDRWLLLTWLKQDPLDRELIFRNLSRRSRSLRRAEAPRRPPTRASGNCPSAAFRKASRIRLDARWRAEDRARAGTRGDGPLSVAAIGKGSWIARSSFPDRRVTPLQPCPRRAAR